MKITPEVLDAVSRAAEHYGNVSQLAKTMGVAHSTILFWQSGKTTHISGKLWATKIKHILQPFFTSGPQMMIHEPATGVYNVGRRPMQTMIPQQAQLLQPYSQLPQLEQPIAQPEQPIHRPLLPKPAVSSQRAPIHHAHVISVQNLIAFDPALETFGRYVARYSLGKHSFFHECAVPGTFFSIEAKELEVPFYPDGAYILVEKKTPKNNDTVLVRYRDINYLLVCKYTREGDIVTLDPIYTPSGCNVPKSWNCQEQRGVLLWAFPLIELNMLFCNEDEEVKKQETSLKPENEETAAAESAEATEAAEELPAEAETADVAETAEEAEAPAEETVE